MTKEKQLNVIGLTNSGQGSQI